VTKKKTRGSINRRGPLSHDDKAYILEHFTERSVEQIAKQLMRGNASIKKYIAQMQHSQPGGIASKDIDVAYDLTSREFWPSIQRQFTQEELKLFRADWAKTIKQFGGDVTHTEEKQIVQSCSLTIMMYRCMEEIHKSSIQLSRFEKLYNQELDREDRDKDLLMQIDNQLASVRAASTSLTNQYDKLLGDQDKMNKSLKSTRDQRIDKLQQDKTTFFDWLRQLADPENLIVESKEIEIRRVAAWRAYLMTGAQLHRYEDGHLDQPILNAETVELVPAEADAERRAIEIAGPNYNKDLKGEEDVNDE